MNEDKEADVPENSGAEGRPKRELWEIAKVLGLSLAIVLPIRYFVVQPFIVRGASMEPNFDDREYLVIDELSYFFREPRRGEVVVFRYPRDPKQYFIKRVIGLPGETVEISGGRIHITTSAAKPATVTLEEPYLDPPNHPTYPEIRVRLDEGQYFVLGDNRDFSSDSRVWGALDRDLIVGRAFIRAWPFVKFGVLDLPEVGMRE
jgi:signal peptidase I